MAPTCGLPNNRTKSMGRHAVVHEHRGVETESPLACVPILAEHLPYIGQIAGGKTKD